MAVFPDAEVIGVSLAKISQDNVYARGNQDVNRIGVVFTVALTGDPSSRQYTDPDSPVLELIVGRRYRFVVPQRLGAHVFYLAQAGSVGGVGLGDALAAADLGDPIFLGDVVGGLGIRVGSIEFTAPADPFTYNCSVPGHTGMGGPVGVRAIVTACNTCAGPATDACARCNRVNYCSEACQRTGWPAHRVQCISADVGTTSSWVQLDLEPIVGIARQIAIPRQAFSAFGRDERVELTTAPGGTVATLTFRHARPLTVSVSLGQEIREIQATETQRLGAGAVVLNYTAPPTPIKAAAAAVKTHENLTVRRFFKSGQGFRPPIFFSGFIVNSQEVQFLGNNDAPKTQYIRRVIMLMILQVGAGGRVDELARALFEPWSGTVGGLGWSWSRVRELVLENSELFTVDAGEFAGQVDAWLLAVQANGVQ